MENALFHANYYVVAVCLTCFFYVRRPAKHTSSLKNELRTPAGGRKGFFERFSSHPPKLSMLSKRYYCRVGERRAIASGFDSIGSASAFVGKNYVDLPA